MHDFIRAVRPDLDKKPELRWLVAEYVDDGCTYRSIWVITQEWEVWHAHPSLIKSLLDQIPLLHPRFISWYTIEPGKLWDN